MSIRDNMKRNRAKILALTGEGLALFFGELSVYIVTLLPSGSPLSTFLNNTAIILKVVMTAIIMYVFGNKRELDDKQAVINTKDSELQAAFIKSQMLKHLLDEGGIKIPVLEDKEKIV